MNQGESGASLTGSKYSLSVELKEMEKSLLKQVVREEHSHIIYASLCTTLSNYSQ